MTSPYIDRPARSEAEAMADVATHTAQLIRADGQYRTRNGRAAYVLAIVPGLEDDLPVVAIVTDGDGSRSVATYSMTGRYLKGEESLWDLIPTDYEPCPHCHGTGRHPSTGGAK